MQELLPAGKLHPAQVYTFFQAQCRSYCKQVSCIGRSGLSPLPCSRHRHSTAQHLQSDLMQTSVPAGKASLVHCSFQRATAWEINYMGCHTPCAGPGSCSAAICLLELIAYLKHSPASSSDLHHRPRHCYLHICSAQMLAACCTRSRVTAPCHPGCFKSVTATRSQNSWVSHLSLPWPCRSSQLS